MLAVRLQSGKGVLGRGSLGWEVVGDPWLVWRSSLLWFIKCQSSYMLML